MKISSLADSLPTPATRPGGGFLDCLWQQIEARPLYGFALLLLATLAIYSPALNGPPVWDDQFLVGDNPLFRSPIFSLEVFRHFLTVESPSTYYRPVQTLSYILDYAIWGGVPLGYHLSNILIHCTAGFLLWRLLRAILPAIASDTAAWVEGAAFLVALVWTVHPIHNAAVAYISGRADSLATLFAAAAWLSFLRAGRFPRGVGLWAWSVAGCLLYLLALCSKEIALIWLPLFAVTALLFDRETPRRRQFAAFAGAVAMAGLYLLLRSLPTASGEAPHVEAAPLAARLLLALRAFGDYAALILYPGNLHMDRMLLLPPGVRAGLGGLALIRFEALTYIGVFAIAGVLLACASRRAGQRLRWYGALWFVIAFLPVSNLFPLNAQSAEHWIYLASLGALVFAAGCVAMLPRRVQAWAPAVVIGLACLFGARTAWRSEDWADPTRFFARTMDAGGASGRVQLNLALVVAREVGLQEGEKIMRAVAAESSENNPLPRITLGINLYRQGRLEEAESLLVFTQEEGDRIARECAYFWTGELYLACLLHDQQRDTEALAVLDSALARRPGFWALLECKAKIAAATQGTAAGLALVRPYVERNWWHYGANMLLADLLQKYGDTDAALECLRLAAKLDIHKGDSFARIAEIEHARGRIEAAHAAQQRAVDREPELPSQRLLLAALLQEMGRDAEARVEMNVAKTLRSGTTPLASNSPAGI